MLNLQQARDYLNRLIWEPDLGTLPGWRARALFGLRVAYAVLRDLSEGQINLRAMSLVYTTLLSLVPLLAVSFSVLKAFGVHNQIEPLMLNFLAPLGEKGVEISQRVVEFVENVRAGLLGSLGLAVLIYTVVSLIQKIERSFNFTWHVTQNRPFSQRFSDYLSVILVGPVLIFSAIGLTASVTSTTFVQWLTTIEPVGGIITLASRLLPYLLVIAAFSFIYVFVPNTKVRVKSALIGAIIAGVLWETAGWLFASFVVNSTKYTAIYSAFATLIVFMIWVYVSWVILLVGASIAYYHQHPENLAAQLQPPTLSARMKEQVALAIMALIAEHYYMKQELWSVDQLSQHLRLPMEPVESVIGDLEHSGLLARTLDEPPRYVPAQAPESMLLHDILESVRAAGEQGHLTPASSARLPAVDRYVGRVEGARERALEGATLKDLVVVEPPTQTRQRASGG